MDSSPVYEDVAQALVDAGSTVHASEAHGCLSGGLAARRDYSEGDWLEEFLPEATRAAGGASTDSLFSDVFRKTSEAMRGFDMAFEPLLPGDETPIAERAQALAAWCQGFLYGLGAAGTAAAMPMSEETSEVLADLAEIARVGSVGADEAEVEEASYAEIVEFLRAGVQLIYEELDPWRQGQVVPETQH
jgi:uncharacterized protein YgfB (UPF0149 family)